jgi:hypothetical protein
MYKKRDIAMIFFLLIILPFLVMGVQVVRDYSGRAYVVEPANIVIHADQVTGPLPHNWQALAQGGEEKGVRMLENVIPKVAELQPRFIRIDHIYDFYDVVNVLPDGALIFNWTELDKTVCDILQTGAKPFFNLGYMPETLSQDGTLIGAPKNWHDWQIIVQKTIGHYSGDTICGEGLDENLVDVYYEVWNEPDLETFGKWSIHGGTKDYKLLYYYAVKGAEEAVTNRTYFIGGPAITAAYQNWFQLFINYVDAYNLRLDFLSWHHYGSDTNSFARDMKQIDYWLSDEEYEKYRQLPRIISEWGFDSGTNPLSETNIAAAHTVSAIRYLVEENLEMAFAFEIKDGPIPRWGILSYDGTIKPRYQALQLLNVLGNIRLQVEGEGSHVKALASRKPGSVSVVLVNYDLENQHSEIVPFAIEGLTPGDYTLTRNSLDSVPDSTFTRVDETGRYAELVPMEANSIVTFELISL